MSITRGGHAAIHDVVLAVDLRGMGVDLGAVAETRFRTTLGPGFQPVRANDVAKIPANDPGKFRFDVIGALSVGAALPGDAVDENPYLRAELSEHDIPETSKYWCAGRTARCSVDPMVPTEPVLSARPTFSSACQNALKIASSAPQLSDMPFPFEPQQ